ncbi:hypothetical protein STH267 [Symbiobacterium thermophilum IAM 14863]|uniref:Uncharacterized protein n=1 Tax=Symbiobacterium thermophilum (strain DSM 24528 / JCM 14929 / IAM 14863 / T) TaxID=292459 RepID=Q67SU1_SYMTH|nr:hypothetical protein STH267 [Symbiobacterium thermophilum IAM 14863]
MYTRSQDHCRAISTWIATGISTLISTGVSTPFSTDVSTSPSTSGFHAGERGPMPTSQAWCGPAGSEPGELGLRIHRLGYRRSPLAGLRNSPFALPH